MTSPPATSAATTAGQQHTYLQKAAFHSPAATTVDPAQYRDAKVSVDEDFDTWERIFKGFKLNPAYNRHPHVQRFVAHYGQNPQQLSLLSERASLFLHMIIHEVERRGMPSELAFLPFVESAFDPDVFSHAGAAGLWQFIPDTGKRYGLIQAKAYDARMDPFAATGAALSYLQELHDMFGGDWLLALAAYNCGENRVQREIERNRARGLPTRYWDLSLPKETREYVPRLLAFKELISNAQRYGITLADTPNTAKLAQLRVDKPVDLRQAALAAGLPTDTLTDLNPSFRLGISMPQYSNRIIVPRRYAHQLVQAIDALPPATISSTYARRSGKGYNRLATVRLGKKRVLANKAGKTRIARNGEPLQRLAQRHGKNVDEPLRPNGKRSNKVRGGGSPNVNV